MPIVSLWNNSKGVYSRIKSFIPKDSRLSLRYRILLMVYYSSVGI